MKNKIKIISIIILLLLSGIVAYSLATREANNDKEDSELKIAVSIFPLHDMVRNVVGDDVEIVQILPTGTSPHTYEPTIQDKAELENVDVLFYIGQGLDEWALGGIEADVVLVDLSNYVDLHESDHDHDHEDEEEHDEGYDPHYWLSVTEAMDIVAAIEAHVSSIDEDNSAYYAQNTAGYIEELTTLRDEMRELSGSIVNNKIVTFHSAFGYFAEDLGFEVVANVEEFPGKEPTPAYLVEVVDVIQDNNLSVIYKEPQLSDSIVAPLAEDYGIEVYVLDPLGGVEGRYSYISLIRYNVETIIDANSN